MITQEQPKGRPGITIFQPTHASLKTAKARAPNSGQMGEVMARGGGGGGGGGLCKNDLHLDCSCQYKSSSFYWIACSSRWCAAVDWSH